MKRTLAGISLSFGAWMAMASEPMLTVHTFRVQKMMCASCVARVKKSISAQPGVSNVSVELSAGVAKFHCQTKAAACDLAKIKKDLARIGFPVR